MLGVLLREVHVSRTTLFFFALCLGLWVAAAIWYGKTHSSMDAETARYIRDGDLIGQYDIVQCDELIRSEANAFDSAPVNKAAAIRRLRDLNAWDVMKADAQYVLITYPPLPGEGYGYIHLRTIAQTAVDGK